MSTRFHARPEVGAAHPTAPRWQSLCRLGDDDVSSLRVEPRTPPLGCPIDDDQVALFVDAGYGGQCVVKGVASYPTYRDVGLPFDSISSLRVGAHVQATLCSDGQFEGPCEVFTADDNILVDNPVGDDEVSSVRVEVRASE